MPFRLLVCWAKHAITNGTLTKSRMEQQTLNPFSIIRSWGPGYRFRDKNRYYKRNRDICTWGLEHGSFSIFRHDADLVLSCQAGQALWGSCSLPILTLDCPWISDPATPRPDSLKMVIGDDICDWVQPGHTMFNPFGHGIRPAKGAAFPESVVFLQERNSPLSFLGKLLVHI